MNKTIFLGVLHGWVLVHSFIAKNVVLRPLGPMPCDLYKNTVEALVLFRANLLSLRHCSSRLTTIMETSLGQSVQPVHVGVVDLVLGRERSSWKDIGPI